MSTGFTRCEVTKAEIPQGTVGVVSVSITTTKALQWASAITTVANLVGDRVPVPVEPALQPVLDRIKPEVEITYLDFAPGVDVPAMLERVAEHLRARVAAPHSMQDLVDGFAQVGALIASGSLSAPDSEVDDVG